METTPAAPLQIEWVELTLKVDATLTAGTYGGQPSEWIKPGAEIKMHMHGVPDPAQMATAYNYAYEQLGLSLGQVIEHLQARLAEVV